MRLDLSESRTIMGKEWNPPTERLGLSHVHLKAAWIQGVRNMSGI